MRSFQILSVVIVAAATVPVTATTVSRQDTVAVIRQPAQMKVVPAIDVLGTWHAVSPGLNLSVVKISQQGDQWTAQLWAKCSPVNCDWGPQVLKWMRGQSNFDRAMGVWTSKLSQGDVTRYVIFRREGAELILEHYSTYEGRPSGGYVVDRFVREQ